MEVDLHESLTEMYPGLGYTMSNNDYDTLIWLDTNVPKPSKQTLLLRGQEIINAKPLKKLRQERNKRLAETDWIFSEDYAIDDESYQQWLTYRKALRDLPAVTEDPANPVWPEKPVNPSGITTNISKRQERLLNENIAMRGKITNLERKTTDQELELIQLKRRLNKLESK